MKFLIRILHWFIGHDWSAWRLNIYSPCAYDEVIYYHRDCYCGVYEEREQ